MNRTVYATAYSFSDAGIAMVTEDGKCGFQATDGKLKVEAKYTAPGNFVKVK